MVKKVFYNSSLPRSGSTLLQNILAQNPLFHSSPTSALFRLLAETRAIFSNLEEIKSQNQEEVMMGFRGFLNGAIYGYYNSITDRPYVFDKSRSWITEYKFINEYDPNPKIICMVRDLRSIYSSIEKKFRGNPLKDHSTIDWNNWSGTTTKKRIVDLSNAKIMALPMDGLNQMLLEGYQNKIYFMRFEDFVINPNEEFKRLYNYLELPYFQHRYVNIEQVTNEIDVLYGDYGDHKIKKDLKHLKEDFIEILGQDNCDMIVNGSKWFYDFFKYEI